MKEKADDLRLYLCIFSKKTLLGDFEEMYLMKEYFRNIDMSEEQCGQKTEVLQN